MINYRNVVAQISANQLTGQAWVNAHAAQMKADAAAAAAAAVLNAKNEPPAPSSPGPALWVGVGLLGALGISYVLRGRG